jgi:hypothetical protein
MGAVKMPILNRVGLIRLACAAGAALGVGGCWAPFNHLGSTEFVSAETQVADGGRNINGSALPYPSQPQKIAWVAGQPRPLAAQLMSHPDPHRIACQGMHPEYCMEPMVPHCHGSGTAMFCHSHPGGEQPHAHEIDRE